MFVLNSKTKETIRKSTGLDPDTATFMVHDEIDEQIEHKIGKKLKLKFFNGRGFAARGNVYLSLGRVLRSNWLDKQLNDI